MSTPTYNVTNQGSSQEADRDRRIKVYFIMMSIRMTCVISLLWVRGWWIILVALGAIFLPYFAVLFANEPDHRADNDFEKPQPAAIEPTPQPGEVAEEQNQVIIVDVEDLVDDNNTEAK